MSGSSSGITPLEQRVLASVDALADEMVEFCRAMLRVPTVNPPGREYRACADLIARQLVAFGYEVQQLEAEGHREHTPAHPRVNVVGRLAGAAAHPCLHFNGHYDVVPPGDGWTVDPFGAELKNGRIYGRGACDQKAGIAASIFAVEALRRAGLRLAGTVEQSATVDEESGGYAGVADLCDRRIISRDRQDFVIITEPLNYDRVCIGHRGVYWFEVEARGRIGHGSMPGYGVNAADAMADLVHAFDTRLRPTLAARTTAVPVVPDLARHATLNLNALHGGQDLSVDGFLASCVADRCVAVYDRRYLHEEDLETVRAEIAAMVDEVARRHPDCRFTVQDLWSVPPVLTPPDARVVRTVSQVIGDVVGRPARIVASPGTYDHKHVTGRAGIAECIAYGPGILDLAHLPDEYVEVEHLVASARIMALATARLVGVAPA